MVPEDRMREMAARTGAAPAMVEAEIERLRRAYGEPWRHYHTLGHVAALMELSAAHAGAIADREAVDLAILYHDAVYDPRRTDNEAASAALARERLTLLGFAEALVAKVARYIEATQHLGSPSARAGDGTAAPDSDLDHLLDLDLSVLAAEAEIYSRYAAAVRREYAFVPDAAYRAGRSKVLEAFLAMPHIYRVPALATRWEARARENTAQELAMLGA